MAGYCAYTVDSLYDSLYDSLLRLTLRLHHYGATITQIMQA